MTLDGEIAELRECVERLDCRRELARVGVNGSLDSYQVVVWGIAPGVCNIAMR